MRAELTRAQGAYPDAVSLYQQLLEADERAGDPRSLAMEHYNLGSVLLQLGQLDDAERHLDAALELSRNDAIDQLPYGLLGVAWLAARRGDGTTAGHLLGAVEAHFDEARSAGRRLSLDDADSLLR